MLTEEPHAPPGGAPRRLRDVVTADEAPLTPAEATAALRKGAPRGTDDHAARLPYVLWWCQNGEVVLYDRKYRPIMVRRADGTVEFDHPNRRVRGIVKQRWLYHDGTSPWRDVATRRLCEGVLAAWATRAVAALRASMPPAGDPWPWGGGD